MPTAHDPVAILRERFTTAVARAFGDQLGTDVDPLITAARNPAFGDFQCNVAMPLAKRLGEKPREVAEKIIQQVDVADIAEPLTPECVAGPGFINIRLQSGALSALVGAMDNTSLGVTAASPAQTIVVDLCSVNLAKQMHVGHLRSTVIGDALARTFERLGHRVIRQNHVGDWGLPIAMVVDRLKQLASENAVDLNALTLEALERIYRDANLICAADEKGLEAARKWNMGSKAIAELETQVASAHEATNRAKETLLALQSGDEQALAIWRRVSDITLSECVSLCEKLAANITMEHTAGESSYRDELPALVEDLLARHVAVKSRGAVIVSLEDMGVDEPALVRKSDGGYLYMTTDLAAIRRRVREFGADRVIYAVDARQSLHFRQLFAAAKKVGFTDEPTGRQASLEHAAFGAVLGENGRPLKTRSGENVKLAALIEEAVTRAERVVSEKNPTLPLDERQAVARAVGVGALKYADLSTDRVKDYVFSFDRMLAFEGDTGPYLQYALVRVKSLFRKAQAEHGVSREQIAAARPTLRICEPAEKTLALALLRYDGALDAAAQSLEPHRLCAYLYDLAVSFSGFFENCPVLRAPDDATRDSRLRLAHLTGSVLDDGLRTLGVPVVERM